MFDSRKFAPKDEEEMEDFPDYEDEEDSELDSKLDDYDDEDEEEEEEIDVMILSPVPEPAPLARRASTRAGRPRTPRLCPRSR